MKLPIFLLLFVSYVPLVLLSFDRNSYFVEHLENFSLSRRYFLYFALLVPVMSYLYALTKAQHGEYKKGWAQFYLLVAMLAITPALLSTDAGFYFVFLRNWLEFAANPQLVSPSQVTQNPWLAEIGPILWQQYPTFYGPLFFPLLAPIFALGFSLTACAIIFKCLLALVFIGVIFLFDQLIRERPDRDFLKFALAANPALLINFVLEGHNDLFLVLLLVATIIALKRARWLAGALLYGFSLGIKSVVLGVFPLFFLRPLLWPIVFSPIVLGSMIFEFSIPLIFERLNLLSTKGCFYSCTPSIALLTSSFGSDTGIFLGKLIAVLLIGYLSWRFSQSEQAKFIALVLTTILFFASQWVSPWYLSVPIPFFLLSGNPGSGLNDRFVKTGFALTCYAIFYYFSA